MSVGNRNKKFPQPFRRVFVKDSEKKCRKRLKISACTNISSSLLRNTLENSTARHTKWNLLFEENPTAKPVWGRKNEVPISHEKEKPSKKQQILSQTHNRIRAKVKNLSFVPLNFTQLYLFSSMHLGSPGVPDFVELCLHQAAQSLCLHRLSSKTHRRSVKIHCRPCRHCRLLATFGRQGMVRGAHHSVDVQFALGLSKCQASQKSKEFCDVTNV